jgi:hypothetical protein
MRNRSKAALLVCFVLSTVIVRTAPASATSCVPPVGTLVGRVVNIDGRSVTYRVQTFQPNRNGFLRRSPLPIPGRLVVVRYGRYDHEFLHVGRHYSVTLGPADDGFVSQVDTANSYACAFGTRNADGSAIDTALIRQPHLRRWFFEFVAASVGVGLLTAVWAVRRRRRQRESVEHLLRLGS